MYTTILHVHFFSGDDQKSHSTSPIPVPAERPALTGKSTPESVMACPNQEEGEVQLEDRSRTTLPDKDKEPQQAMLCAAPVGEPNATLVRKLRNKAKQPAESEPDCESHNPNESSTQHVSPECNTEPTTGEEQQTLPAACAVVEEEISPQSMPLSGVVTFKLSDLPEPRERSESMLTEMSSLSGVPNFRAGEKWLMNSVMQPMNIINHLLGLQHPQTCLFA